MFVRTKRRVWENGHRQWWSEFRDVVVAPPFVYINQVKNSITDRIEISAQNSWVGKGGAFTGQISVEQLKDLGVKWVILGHYERRHVIGENDEERKQPML